MKVRLPKSFHIYQADIRSVKGAVCSAVNVMKTVASSLTSVLPKVRSLAFSTLPVKIIKHTFSSGFFEIYTYIYFPSLSMYFLSIIQMEGMNSLVSELADVAARERAMLSQCESLFGSIAALQV